MAKREHGWHFGVSCSCGIAFTSPVTEEQCHLIEKDPVSGFELLPKEDRNNMVAFWKVHHEALGHQMEPIFLGEPKEERIEA